MQGISKEIREKEKRHSKTNVTKEISKKVKEEEHFKMICKIWELSCRMRPWLQEMKKMISNEITQKAEIDCIKQERKRLKDLMERERK
jgi:hypothetical protein